MAFVLLFTAHAAWVVVVKRDFERRLDEIRARGEPVEFAALEPPRPPDERNAAPFYERALAWHYEQDWLDQPDALYECRENWSDEDRAEVRAWLEAQAPFVEMIQQAVARPDCWFELDWTDPLEMRIPMIPASQHATQVLELLAVFAAEEKGGSTRAARHIETILKMGRHQNRSTIIGYLVRVTEDGIAADMLMEIVADPELDARALRARLDPLFREAEDPDARRDAFLGERAFSIHVVSRWIEGEYESFALEPSWKLYVLSSWPGRPLAYLDALKTLEMWDEAIELGGRPYAAARSGYEALVARIEALGFPIRWPSC